MQQLVQGAVPPPNEAADAPPRPPPAPEPAYALHITRPPEVGQEFDVKAEFSVAAPDRGVVESGLIKGHGRITQVESGNMIGATYAVKLLSYANASGRGARTEFDLTYNYRADPKFSADPALKPAELQALSELLPATVAKPGRTDDEVFGTDTAKPVGSSWQADPDKLRVMLEDSGVKVSEASGQVTLDELVECGATRCFHGRKEIKAKGSVDEVPQELTSATEFWLPTDEAFDSGRLTGVSDVDMDVEGEKVRTSRRTDAVYAFDGEGVAFEGADPNGAGTQPAAQEFQAPEMPGILRAAVPGECGGDYKHRDGLCVHRKLLELTDPVLEAVIRQYRDGAPAPTVR